MRAVLEFMGGAAIGFFALVLLVGAYDSAVKPRLDERRIDRWGRALVTEAEEALASGAWAPHGRCVNCGQRFTFDGDPLEATFAHLRVCAARHWVEGA